MAYYSKSLIPAVSAPTPGEFKGFAVLTLPNPGDPTKPGVQLGVKKIAAVLAHLDACRAFVDANTKAKPATPADAFAKALAAQGLSADVIAKAMAALAA